MEDRNLRMLRSQGLWTDVLLRHVRLLVLRGQRCLRPGRRRGEEVWPKDATDDFIFYLALADDVNMHCRRIVKATPVAMGLAMFLLVHTWCC